MRSIEVARSLTPQIVIDLSLAGWRKMTGNTKRLFHGDDRLFKALVREAQVYGEYGMGSSTVWVLDNCNCAVVAVDSSPVWIAHVKKEAQSTTRLLATHVDLGTVARLGRPRDFRCRENFASYGAAIWQGISKPDLVLIDGRFRVSCFLNCLLYGRPGTKILFDDYKHRPLYHVVEEFAAPVEFCGRQALFIVPEEIDRAAIEREAEKFAYVMD